MHPFWNDPLQNHQCMKFLWAFCLTSSACPQNAFCWNSAWGLGWGNLLVQGIGREICGDSSVFFLVTKQGSIRHKVAARNISCLLSLYMSKPFLRVLTVFSENKQPSKSSASRAISHQKEPKERIHLASPYAPNFGAIAWCRAAD